MGTRALIAAALLCVCLDASELAVGAADAAAADPPTQIRLALTGADGELLVAWASSNTSAAPYAPVVLWGADPGGALPYSAAGTTHASYVIYNIRSPRLHSAVITGLSASQPVYFSVGDASASAGGFSAVLRADAPPARGTYPFSIAAYGDLGISNSGATLAMLAKGASAGDFSLACHIGDIGYADNRAGINNGSLYDGVLNELYRLIEPVAARVPYMITVGNHEALSGEAPLFTAYAHRVGPTMPTASSGGDPSAFWYSFDAGPAHFVALSADHDYNVSSPQWLWARADLESVDRARTSWVIVLIHFPLLCSSTFWCPLAKALRASFEPLFTAKRGADIVLAGHVHAAEVLYPSLNMTRVSFSFKDMTVPLQLVNGNPGDIETCCNGSWIYPQPEYSYWRELDGGQGDGFFGWLQLTLLDETRLSATFWDSANASVVVSINASRAPRN